MTIQVGIAFAFVAMLCWGFGDFLMQRSARRIGNMETLFAISLFGAFILLPFVYGDIISMFTGEQNKVGALLVVASAILFVAALLDIESLRIGKLAVVEPIWSFEIPVSGILAFFVLNERLDVFQYILIAILLVGLCLVSFKEKHISGRFLLEDGVWLAFVAAITMGVANFFVGWGARMTSPITVNFFTSAFIAIIVGTYLVGTGRMKGMKKATRDNQQLIIPMIISDNVAWIAFAYAMSLAPLGIAVALSESYIIVAVILGILVNGEKLQKHQKLGLIIALVAATVLAAITGK